MAPDAEIERSPKEDLELVATRGERLPAEFSVGVGLCVPDARGDGEIVRAGSVFESVEAAS